MTHCIRRLALCLAPVPFLLGCSQQPEAESGAARAADPPAAVIAPPQPIAAASAKPNPQPQPQPKAEPPAPPPTFPFPPDQAGKAVAKVVAPDIARPLPVKRAGAAPVPRAIPVKLLEPEALPPANLAVPPLAVPKVAGPKPAAPKEKVPLDLGAGASAPGKPVLPVAAVVTPRARDVELPPPAPALGRPAADRVPFDDPTGDFGNAEVVGGSVKVPLAPSGFLKVAIPDPFELGAQVKPKVPANAEPSAAPVPVTPQRTK
jgi:hypothetical protein